MNGALEGIKVLDLSRWAPGPYYTMILGDLGTDIIKTDPGRQIFYKMVEDADVVLEGFRPGVVNRLGIDWNNSESPQRVGGY
jgi:crotonobetainyl-CoA:carnitine CoA-transferase CaiB-like acyl-CoA transferase